MKHLLILSALLIAFAAPVTVHGQTIAPEIQTFPLPVDSSWQTIPCPDILQSRSLFTPGSTGYLPRLKACTQAVFTPSAASSRFEAELRSVEEDAVVHACNVSLIAGRHNAICSEAFTLKAGISQSIALDVPISPAGTSKSALYLVSDATQELEMTQPVWKSTLTPPQILQGQAATISTGILMTTPVSMNSNGFTLTIDAADVLPDNWYRSWCGSLTQRNTALVVPLSLRQCLFTDYLAAQKQERTIVSGSGSRLDGVVYKTLSSSDSITLGGYINDPATVRTYENSIEERRLIIEIPFGTLLANLSILLEPIVDAVTPEDLPEVPDVVGDPDPIETAPVTPLTTTPAEKAAFDATGVWEGRYIRLRLHPVTASLLLNPRLFVEKLDQIYEYNRDLVGGVPYNGEKINVDEACTGTPNRPPASACPWGYMQFYNEASNSDYWGLAGPPVQIISNGMRRAVLDFNADNTLTFGLIHELGHNFDRVSARPQYMFHTASIEAWANLKLIYLLSERDIDMEWNGTIYSSTEDLLAGFYRNKTAEYLENGLRFEDLISVGPVAGNLTDLYIGVLLPLIDIAGIDSLFDTIKLYKTQENTLRVIPDTTVQDKMNRFAQFLTFWSCKSGKDLATAVMPYRFDTPVRARVAIQYCLDNPAQTKDDAVIVGVDWATASMYLPGGL